MRISTSAFPDKKITARSVALLICLGFLSAGFSGLAVPRHVYLTWQGDTSTTITVNFQTMEDAPDAQVYYDTKSRKGKIADYRFHATGTHHTIEGSADNRAIHWVELISLKPIATYYFVAGDDRNGFSAERKFHTIPDGHQRLRFVDGGDMGTGSALPV